MILPVLLRDEAQIDVSQAARWYDRRVPGLGTDFIRNIDACLTLISRDPAMFPEVYRHARVGLPRKFPYLIIYRVFPEYISVVAVIHGSRHPRRWKSRVAE